MNVTRNKKTEMIQRAAKLHNDGLAVEVIAERLGVTDRTVGSYISRARAGGLVSGASNSVGRLMRTLPPDVREWLDAQVPPGGTVAEMIAAIIADAYYDANHIAFPDTGM